MERKVSWTLPAVRDVEDIRDFIARDSERYAFSFVEKIYKISHSLKTFAERGRMVPELRIQSIRELFVARHRLVYKVFSDRIQIAAVIHMSRDFETAWNERERF